jgi:putative transposase
MAAEGVISNEIAKKVGLSAQSVCKWRQRYLQQGISGLHDELRPGRPRSVSDEQVATLIRKTLNTKPKKGTQAFSHIASAILNCPPTPSL